MQTIRFLQSWLVCAATAFIGFAGPVQAETFALGSIISPASFTIGNDRLLGPFADSFTFSIGTGDSFEFSSFLTTGYTTRWFIPDMQADLYSGETLLLAGNAETNLSPEGFPSLDIGFDPQVLGAGDYQLRVTGTGTPAFELIPSSYSGSIGFAPAVSPVPEPEMLILMTLGLATLGLLSRRLPRCRRGSTNERQHRTSEPCITKRWARWRLTAMLLSTCMMASQHAQAFYLSGSFSGIAQADPLPLGFTPPRPESYYDGAPVTGTFSVFVPDPQFQTGGDDFAYFLNGNGGWLSLSYTIKDASFDFFVGTPDPSSSNLPSVLLLQAPGGPSSFQSVLFLTDFMPKYQGASFELDGPAGSLFDQLDPATLRVDPAAPPTLVTSFSSADASMHVTIDVGHAMFRTISPVPEPATGTLLIAGCALLVWYRRRAPPGRTTSSATR